jgi:oligopeptide transport system ATP-binding protein
MLTPLLDVRDLSIFLPSPAGEVTVVDHVSYRIERGQIFGIAGESGSGKTLSVLALLGLLPAGARVEGEAIFGGRNLLKLPEHQLQNVRGKEIALVLQDPMASLHPMLTVGRLLTEHLRSHLRIDQRSAEKRARELLVQVRIPDPAGSLNAHPHQFSGGMRQRIAIAIAMACQPKLILADEPTTALDVTVQAGILRLFEELRDDTGASFILITHDLGVMSTIADRVTVLYAGRVAECGPTSKILTLPRHPYTASLLASLPDRGTYATPLIPIPGIPPSPADRPTGCAFNPRCGYAKSRCRSEVPPLLPLDDARKLACFVDPFDGLI